MHATLSRISPSIGKTWTDSIDRSHSRPYPVLRRSSGIAFVFANTCRFGSARTAHLGFPPWCPSISPHPSQGLRPRASDLAIPCNGLLFTSNPHLRISYRPGRVFAEENAMFDDNEKTERIRPVSQQNLSDAEDLALGMQWRPIFRKCACSSRHRWARVQTDLPRLFRRP